MKISLICFFLFVATAFVAQSQTDPVWQRFARNWKADPRGLNGFREMHYDSISAGNKAKAGQRFDIAGFDQAQVIALLGRPAGVGRHTEDNCIQMVYPVKAKKGSPQPEIELLIWFDKNDRVADIARSKNAR